MNPRKINSEDLLGCKPEEDSKHDFSALQRKWSDEKINKKTGFFKMNEEWKKNNGDSKESRDQFSFKFLGSFLILEQSNSFLKKNFPSLCRALNIDDFRYKEKYLKMKEFLDVQESMMVGKRDLKDSISNGSQRTSRILRESLDDMRDSLIPSKEVDENIKEIREECIKRESLFVASIVARSCGIIDVDEKKGESIVIRCFEDRREIENAMKEHEQPLKEWRTTGLSVEIDAKNDPYQEDQPSRIRSRL